MALSNKGKIAVLSMIWIGLAAIAAISYKYFVVPAKQIATQHAQEEEKKKVFESTSATPRTLQNVNINLDSFSGYAIYRSIEFKNNCASHGVKINIVDDGANYDARLKALKDGSCQMALFTIDALVKSSANIGDIPGTIIWINDESRGADAMVVNSKTYENIDAFNHPDTKFVVVPNSPSETLALVVKDHFDLDKLGSNPWVYVNSSNEVFDMYRNSKPADHMVFVTWEPVVSKMLENPAYKDVIDSSKFRNYIVDVMVVSRDFLIKNKEVVRKVAESYFSTLNEVNLQDLITKDSKAINSPVTKIQAEQLVKKIQFKNTQENYAHFGILEGYSLQHLESIIEEIIALQLRSKVISKDPTNGTTIGLYFNGIMADLNSSSFHPKKDEVRQDQELKSLSEDQWQKLQPIGSMQVPKLVFRKGSPVITYASEKTLEDLVGKLKKWPYCYLIIRGNCSSDGDKAANLALAEMRSKSTKDWLVAHGINSNRIKTEAIKPNGTTTVTFVLAELPY